MLYFMIGENISLTIPTSLMTCNNGQPDGDIMYLLVLNNSLIINGNYYYPFTGYTGYLSLTFDDINNANTLIGDVNNVSDWNSFFNLPIWSTPFASVSINSNTVILTGGENIIIKNQFQENIHLTEVSDEGCICYINDYCFNSCTSVTLFNLPKLTIAGDNCFSNCTLVESFNLPLLQTAGNSCFYNCESVTSINLSSLVTAGNYCFYNWISFMSSFTLPLLQTAGNSCFYYSSASSFNLPRLITAGNYCFSTSLGLTIFYLPVLTTAGDNCFYECDYTTTFDLPNLITVGNNCFAEYMSAETFNLPSCINLGETVGDDNVFSSRFAGLSNKNISLTIPTSLMICNNGYPDGDIMYLSSNYSVTINGSLFQTFSGYTGNLSLTFDDINNANVLVGDSANVSDWNSLFDLPAWSTLFTSVQVSGNTITLIGGENIIIRRQFQSNTHLIEVSDEGCVCYIYNNNTFGGCFYNCTSVTTFNLPSLQNAGYSSFYNCISVTTFNLPSLQTAGYISFCNCTSATSFYLPLCVNLGSTVGEDGVFYDIIGENILLTIPTSLMTCNSGSPDGDIQYLQSNNTVTITQI